MACACLALMFNVVGAATVTWDGDGDGVRWLDPVNWVGNALPGELDDAVLPAGSEVLVDGAVSVRSATIRRPLRVRQVTVSTVLGLEFIGGELRMEGSTLTGPVLLRGSVLGTGEGSSSAEPLILSGTTTLEGTIPSGMTVTVMGNGQMGDGVLVWSEGRTNRGVLRLDSQNAGYRSTVRVAGGSLVNLGGGVVEALPGTGGERRVDGDVVNEGTIRAAAETVLRVEREGVMTVIQRGGVLEAGAGGRLELVRSELEWSGGAMTGLGQVHLVNGTVRVGSGVTQASVLILGGFCRLLGNESEVVTLWTQGSGRFGQGRLELGTAAENRGSLVFESRDAGWGSWIDTLGNRLSNAVTGRMVFRPGSGGNRSFSGVLANAGRVEGETGTGVNLEGTYEGHGGVVVGDARFRNTRLSLVLSPVTANTLVLDGSDNELLTDVPAGYELHVRGGGSGQGLLTSRRSFRNAGVLRLESVGAGWASSLNLPEEGNRELWNLSGGIVRAGAGTGGVRAVTGDLRNEGRIEVAAGVVLAFSRPGGVRFVHAGGVIESVVGGRVQVRDGEFGFTGGTVLGELDVADCRVDVGVDAGTAWLRLGGAESRLVGQRSVAVTLWVRGSGGFGQARLTAETGSVNAGVLLLESADAGWSSTLVTAPGAVLENGLTGVIRAGAGSGGVREFAGTMRNAGRLESVDGLRWNFRGTYRSAGGWVSGTLDFIGSTLDLTLAPASGSVFEVRDAGNRLESELPVGTRIRLAGAGSFGHADLLLPANFRNRGHLVADSETAGWRTTFESPGGGTVRNEVGGRIELLPGAGGRRVFTGAVENNGTLVVSADSEWRAGLKNGQTGEMEVTPTTVFMPVGVEWENAGRIGFIGSSGTVQINGGYRQLSDGRLILPVQAGGWGRVQADGTIFLDGTLEVGVPAGGGRLRMANCRRW